MVKYMNYISNVFSYIYSVFKPIYKNNDESLKEQNIDILITTQPIEPNEPNELIETADNITYIFINTANIYNATDMMLNKLSMDNYNNKYIKIYLLKSHTLEPLFKNSVKVNQNNLKLIKNKMSKRRRHLHTFIDAIESFIEYNNIKNYNIYY
jgi:hypothetical protein